MTSVFVNGVLAFVMIITISFTLGDVTRILATPTGFPFIQIFYDTTNSYVATNLMTTLLIVTLTASIITTIATASRQLWSFARDRGVPFSSFISHVGSAPRHPPPSPQSPVDEPQVTQDWNIPLNAVLISLVIAILLSLINIGSSVALNAILSVNLGALFTSYMISIGCVLLKRFKGEPLPPARWSLGRYGMAINMAAICFLLPLFVFIFFPIAIPVTLSTMNWGSVMYVGVMSFAAVYYFLYGRYSYIPPVVLVRRDV